MKRKTTSIHNYWHRRVQGQIRDCIYNHPEYFRFGNELEREVIVNSLAKRIVGEIVADLKLAAVKDDDGSKMLSSSKQNGCDLGVAAISNGECPVSVPHFNTNGES